MLDSITKVEYFTELLFRSHLHDKSANVFRVQGDDNVTSHIVLRENCRIG